MHKDCIAYDEHSCGIALLMMSIVVQCNGIALLMISIVVQCNRRISNELELNCLISIVVQCIRNRHWN